MTYVDGPRTLILDATQPLHETMRTYTLLWVLRQYVPCGVLWAWQVPQRQRVIVVGSVN